MFLLFRRYKRSRLTKLQFDKLADYTGNLSLFFLGSILAPLFTQKEKMPEISIIAGAGLTLIFLGVSMYLAKRSEL